MRRAYREWGVHSLEGGAVRRGYAVHHSATASSAGDTPRRTTTTITDGSVIAIITITVDDIIVAQTFIIAMISRKSFDNAESIETLSGSARLHCRGAGERLPAAAVARAASIPTRF